MKDRSEWRPRALTERERELLLWVLPADRPGYRKYRDLVERWSVTAQGRRGTGNYILSPLDERADTESPLPQVLSYGVVETDKGEISVTVRERLGSQIEFEIAKLGQGEIEQPFSELRRWTFSSWSPGEPCPICRKAIRAVEMKTTTGHRMVFAVCALDERLWVFDAESLVSHPVPVTNFYNELMLHRRVRDPEIAFDPRRLFSKLDEFRDEDLIRAFSSYNKVRTKIPLEGEILQPAPRREPSLLRRLVSVFRNS